MKYLGKKCLRLIYFHVPVIWLRKSNGVKQRVGKDHFGCIRGKTPNNSRLFEQNSFPSGVVVEIPIFWGPIKLDWSMKLKYAVRNNIAFLQGNARMTPIGNGLGYLIRGAMGFL